MRNLKVYLVSFFLFSVHADADVVKGREGNLRRKLPRDKNKNNKGTKPPKPTNNDKEKNNGDGDDRDGGIDGGGISLPYDQGPVIQPDTCMPYAEAAAYMSFRYPGDWECQIESGRMGTSAACCRSLPFTDYYGNQHYWMKYDPNNQYSETACVCNENTAVSNGEDRTGEGDFGNGFDIDFGGNSTTPEPTPMPITPEPTPIPTPTATPNPTGTDRTCYPENLSPIQESLREAEYLTACKSSDECPSTQCCSTEYCVCWARSPSGNGCVEG